MYIRNCCYNKLVFIWPYLYRLLSTCLAMYEYEYLFAHPYCSSYEY